MFRSIAIAVVAIVLGAGAAFAASAVFNVNVTIRQPIVVTCPGGSGDLVFGTVDADSGVTYTVTAAAGAQAPPLDGTAHSANCTIQGELGQTPSSVTVTGSALNQATLTGAGTDIIVTLTQSAPSFPFVAAPLDIFVGGAFTIPTLPAVQLSGAYTGTATLTVIY